MSSRDRDHAGPKATPMLMQSCPSISTSSIEHSHIISDDKMEDAVNATISEPLDIVKLALGE